MPRSRESGEQGLGGGGTLLGAALLLTWLVFSLAVYAGRPLFSTGATLLASATVAVLFAGLRERMKFPRSCGIVVLAVVGLSMPLVGGYGSILPLQAEYTAVMVASGFCLVAAALLSTSNPRMDDLATLVSAAVFTGLSAFVILNTKPTIDVWNFTDQAASAVFSENIYGKAWEGASPFADPFIVTAGFPYLPMTAALLAPFRWFLGDVRWGMLACLLTSGAILWVQGRGDRRRAALPVLFWFTPGTLLMVETAWTESLVLVLLFLSLLAFSHERPNLGVCLLALTLATKQHSIVTLPVLAAWRFVGVRRALAAAGGAAALCLPWILVDPRQFYEDTVRFHLDVEPRLDADTLYALAIRHGWTPPFLLVGLLAVVAVAVITRRVSTHQPALAGITIAAALTLLVVNLVNKQAFLNQYWLVGGLMLFAMACSEPDHGGGAGRAASESVQDAHLPRRSEDEHASEPEPQRPKPS